MSVERPFEALEEVQRHGMDIADKLAQGFTELIQSHMTPPSFSWPNSTPSLEFPIQNFTKHDLGRSVDDLSYRIGQVGADFGASINGVVEQFVRRFPLPFRHDENVGLLRGIETHSQRTNIGIAWQEDFESEQYKDYGISADGTPAESSSSSREDAFGVSAKILKLFGRSQGTFNMSTTYNSRTGKAESSLVAEGDMWRVEASQGSSTSGNEKPPLFLLQLGPVLFFHDSTLLLPVHLSNQHFLWYGYDRKNRMHSICPALWSKRRRWLFMSTIHLNPLACSFMDLQFPNGQITYTSGEGFSTSAFLQLWGGLLQANGQYPGEMRFSFSMKNKWGTHLTPSIQWPDKSVALGMEQALAWRRSGLLVKPVTHFSIRPTFGGSHASLQLELLHSVKEELSLICGCTVATDHPSAFASVSIGRSKWNGNVGDAGVVLKFETPLGDHHRHPSFSVQLNTGFDF